MPTCQPWVTEDELMECAAGSTTAQRTEAAEVATSVLFALFGGRWPGICSEVVRPCSGRGGPGRQHLEGSNTWIAWGEQGTSWGWCGCGQWDDCGCGGLSFLQLRHDALAVEEVLVDGSSLADADYRLYRGGRLYRTTPAVWPCCQDLSREVTEAGTWQVSYEYGALPPELAVAAARTLACEIALALGGEDCALPERVTSVTRQGVSFAVLDPQDFLTQGRTGIYSVDLALAALNPEGLKRSGSVWWPGRQRLAREVEAAGS